MKILALETATYFGGVALVNGEKCLAMGPFAPRESSREVLHAVHCLIQQNHIGLDELELVAVSTGPGLFTGVRIGLYIAKTLCWGNPMLPLVGIPTLDAVASLVLRSQNFQQRDRILAVTDARRGEVYAAAYKYDGAFEAGSAATGDGFIDNALSRLCPDMVVRPDRLKEHMKNTLGNNGTLWMIGDGMNRYPEILAQQFPQAQAYPHDQPNLAIHVAMLGRDYFRLSGAMKPETLQPHYVRRPDARLPAGPFLSAGNSES